MTSWSKTAAFATLALMTVTPAVQHVLAVGNPEVAAARRHGTTPIRAETISLPSALSLPAAPEYAQMAGDAALIQKSFDAVASVNPGAMPGQDIEIADVPQNTTAAGPQMAALRGSADDAKPAGDAARTAAAADPRKAADKLSRSALEALVRKEAARRGVPSEIAMAVVKVESNWDATRKGDDGEIGLFQVVPRIAKQFGFHGSTDELWDPNTNVKWGMAYVGGAYRKAGGDLCRTAMKIAGGNYVEEMKPAYQAYCDKLKAAIGPQGVADLAPAPAPAEPAAAAKPAQ